MGTAPVTVAFTDTSTGAPVAWSWSVGDGHVSSAPSPVHTYARPGVYDVSLTELERLGVNWNRDVRGIQNAGNEALAEVTNSVSDSCTAGRNPIHDRKTRNVIVWFNPQESWLAGPHRESVRLN